MMHYELRHGSYYLLDDKKNNLTGDYDILYMCDEVAIAFSTCELGVVLHKHGSPDKVYKWFEDARKKYLAAGLDKEAAGLGVVTGKFPVEELNKILDCTGYLTTFLKNNLGNAMPA